MCATNVDLSRTKIYDEHKTLALKTHFNFNISLNVNTEL